MGTGGRAAPHLLPGGCFSRAQRILSPTSLTLPSPSLTCYRGKQMRYVCYMYQTVLFSVVNLKSRLHTTLYNYLTKQTAHSSKGRD